MTTTETNYDTLTSLLNFVVKMSPTSCIAAKASSASSKFLPLRAIQPIHAHSSRLCTNLRQQQTKKKPKTQQMGMASATENISKYVNHLYLVPTKAVYSATKADGRYCRSYGSPLPLQNLRLLSC